MNRILLTLLLTVGFTASGASRPLPAGHRLMTAAELLPLLRDSLIRTYPNLDGTLELEPARMPTAAAVLAVLGVGVAVVGLVLITLGGRATAGIRQGIVWGLTSGLGYGCGMAVLIDTSSASGPWPAMTQRSVAFLLTLLLAVGSRSRPFPPKGDRRPPLLSGAFGGLASTLYVLGVQADALPAAVTGAMFPAVSVALGRIVFGDVVRPAQLLGLGFVLVGVAGVVGG